MLSPLPGDRHSLPSRLRCSPPSVLSSLAPPLISGGNHLISSKALKQIYVDSSYDFSFLRMAAKFTKPSYVVPLKWHMFMFLCTEE
ncbi:hypothetical protein L6452_00560 [Arctium lappa]|uniref:Uncharacterized protein n=1 Tax=Arctium lappa TaxID=4217 RepID=A0ACB9FF85_ARCLA|nr:hypothetical protein L6452_00560 [Arctium lappa]